MLLLQIFAISLLLQLSVQGGCTTTVSCQHKSSGAVADAWCSSHYWLCFNSKNLLCRTCPDDMPYWDYIFNRCTNTTCESQLPVWLGTNRTVNYDGNASSLTIMSPNLRRNGASNGHDTNRQHLNITDIFTGETVPNDPAYILLPGVYQFGLSESNTKYAFRISSNNGSNYESAVGKKDPFSSTDCKNSRTCLDKPDGPAEDVFCSNNFWLCLNGENYACKKCPTDRPYWDSFNNQCSTSCTNPRSFKMCQDPILIYKSSRNLWLIDSPNYPQTYYNDESCNFYLINRIPANLTFSTFNIYRHDKLTVTNIQNGDLMVRFKMHYGGSGYHSPESLAIELQAGVYMLSFSVYPNRISGQGQSYGFRLLVSSNQATNGTELDSSDSDAEELVAMMTRIKQEMTIAEPQTQRHHICEPIEEPISLESGPLILRSHEGGGTYGANLDCSIQIIAPTGSQIQIETTYLNTEQGYDILRIAENEYSGDIGPDTTVSVDGPLNLIFTSDGRTSLYFRGFKIKFSFKRDD